MSTLMMKKEIKDEVSNFRLDLRSGIAKILAVLFKEDNHEENNQPKKSLEKNKNGLNVGNNNKRDQSEEISQSEANSDTGWSLAIVGSLFYPTMVNILMFLLRFEFR